MVAALGSNVCLIIIVLLLMCLIVQMSKVLGKRKHEIYSMTIVLSTFIYLCGVFYFTFLHGSRAGLSGISIKLPMPFWKAVVSRDYSIVTHRSLLNVLLFVPFGYLLPHFKRLTLGKAVLLGFCFSLLIETSQLTFHFGVFQLDDLVKNTMGAGLGWMLYTVLNRKEGTG